LAACGKSLVFHCQLDQYTPRTRVGRLSGEPPKVYRSLTILCCTHLALLHSDAIRVPDRAKLGLQRTAYYECPGYVGVYGSV
jgi:hypothetical protein